MRQEDFPDKDIDFIVFTGDLHTYGRDYNEGKRFLAGLAERYHLNPNEDVFIVPGNHDVDPYRSLTEEIDAVKSEKGRKDGFTDGITEGAEKKVPFPCEKRREWIPFPFPRYSSPVPIMIGLLYVPIYKML